MYNVSFILWQYVWQHQVSSFHHDHNIDDDDVDDDDDDDYDDDDNDDTDNDDA